jgi:hypothetical protein
MQAVKLLTGLSARYNGSGTKLPLRCLLLVMSFGDVMATSLLNETPIDTASVTSIAKALVETVLAAYLSHKVYQAG